MSGIIRKKNPGEAWESLPDTGSSGSTPGAARVLGPFPFSFDTPNINDGVVIYTPAVGDILLDAWVSILTGFDGTTPKVDVGQFSGTSHGWWFNIDSDPVPVSDADDFLVADPTLLTGPAGRSPLYFNANFGNSASLLRQLPAAFLTADPILVVLSQTGAKGGAAVGGTQGQGSVYLVVATPSLT